ncbi:glycosyltransferase [Rubrivivax gelatinosus]|uniref:glycosyltransferase n=1 Tax=Rubrivivax gelatinosus TaxID=28068 RepID=UPI001F5BD398|nr:glycosyltransferase [Rubrivivax gelatinosus]
MSLPVLVVFSHLRWSFVWQRPQHLMSRLARRWRVVFVEEPVHDTGPARLEVHDAMAGVSVLVPHTPVLAAGFHDDQLALLEPLVAHHLHAAGVREAVVWLYTPMALPLVKTLALRCLAYDCMDELAAFKDAPRQLRQRENALLKRADVVFTGGPSLYDAKRELHPNVHCIPSSVDAAHFEPAGLVAGSEHALAAAALQGALPGPRLGYYGVIDERLDLALVAALADARPEWQIVMVGPVVKIAPESLPRRANLHWLGMQPYARLPYLLAGWDLALMPFAINDATRFISPTKTLEYMAGEKATVSTPVRDVVSLYGDVVSIARDSAGFVEACETLLAESVAARCQRVMRMLNAVSAHSWERSADCVHDLLVQATVRATPARVEALAPAAPAAALAASAGGRA